MSNIISFPGDSNKIPPPPPSDLPNEPILLLILQLPGHSIYLTDDFHIFNPLDDSHISIVDIAPIVNARALEVFSYNNAIKLGQDLTFPATTTVKVSEITALTYAHVPREHCPSPNYINPHKLP